MRANISRKASCGIWIDRDRKMLRENGLIVTKIDLMRTKQLKKHLLMLLHVFCAGHRMNHQVSLLNREATQGEHKRFRSMREVFHPMHRTKTCTTRGPPTASNACEEKKAQLNSTVDTVNGMVVIVGIRIWLAAR